ncbi:Flocculation suppression protein [Basidiobolus ranarum]|uniref:Flocculation suppression protein n=1 Tax=Basidiobolus ranarum TaxID=34480 RepID=A0ABR2WD87_9FUNG
MNQREGKQQQKEFTKYIHSEGEYKMICLLRWYKHGHYYSRQLNNYGFGRVSDQRRTKQSVDTSSIVYSHRYFKRDQPDSLHLIQRISGPYSKARNQVSIQGKTKDIRPKLLPSPLSPALTPTSLVSLYSISQDQCNSICTKDTVVDCSSCTALKHEVAALRKTIEYYKSLVENSVKHINIPSNDEEVCAIDKSQSLIPSFTVLVSPENSLLGLWANSNPNVYSYFCPYPSSMDDNEWFPKIGSNR